MAHTCEKQAAGNSKNKTYENSLTNILCQINKFVDALASLAPLDFRRKTNIFFGKFWIFGEILDFWISL